MGALSMRAGGGKKHWRGGRAVLRSESTQSTHARAQTAPVVAKWLVPAAFGQRMAVCKLLHEWLDEVAQPAGADTSKARVLAGAIGQEETTVELELGVWSLAELENTLASVNTEKHWNWASRLQHCLAGSPRWVVLNAVSKAQAGAASSLPPSHAPSSAFNAHEYRSESESEQGVGEVLSAQPEASLSQPATPTAEDDNDGGKWMVDWKGDWLKINPNDSLPGLA